MFFVVNVRPTVIHYARSKRDRSLSPTRRGNNAHSLSVAVRLPQFANLLARNELVPTLLKFRQATVFAPNNEAMRAYDGPKDQDLLLYHLGNLLISLDAPPNERRGLFFGQRPLSANNVRLRALSVIGVGRLLPKQFNALFVCVCVCAANVALTTDKLDQSVSSELPGNPPLWIARRDANAYQFDLFVNDARVVRGDIKANSIQQDQQVCRHLSPLCLSLWRAIERGKQPTSCDLMRLTPQRNLFVSV